MFLGINDNANNQTATRPVILLNGLFGSKPLWQPVLQALGREHRVYVPVFPLFDLPPHQTNVKHLTKLLHEFIETHNLSDVILIGHALGGQLALLYAHQHPGHVHKIVLVSSVGFDENPVLIQPYEGTLTFDFVQQRVKSAFYTSSPYAAELSRSIYEVVKHVPNRVALDSYSKSSRQLRVSLWLHKIDQPVLLVWGLHDAISSPESALHFQDLLFNSEVKFIDHCGHVPMLEKPAEFIEAVQQFLSPRRRLVRSA